MLQVSVQPKQNEPDTNSGEGEDAVVNATVKRRANNVLTLHDRARVVRWMVAEVEKTGTHKRIQSKTIKQFPFLFRSSHSANFMRAKRLWEERNELLDSLPRPGARGGVMISVANVAKIGKKRIRSKARVGRGRKCDAWVVALEADLVLEFDRMRKLGMKLATYTLSLIAKEMIRCSTNASYNRDTCSGRERIGIVDLITTAWIQRFMHRHNIVMRRQTGKLQISPEAQERIERRVAYFLGNVARQFSSGELVEENVENADETHFIINMDDGRTLGFGGDQSVKYADVTSGGEGMTMLVRISGGARAMVETPFMIFKNKDSNYPIRGVEDDIPGVCYRTGPKGWIDRRVMLLWTKEKRALPALPNGQRRVLFLDNCAGHALTDDLKGSLVDINTEVRFFPANATDLLQPADSFVIQKIKTAWRKRWEEHKAILIRAAVTSNSYGTASGLFKNPGKKFFLKLAAAAVRDVNKERDENGMTYARKAMIRCGLSKQKNGLWEIRQLFPHLQTIISQYRINFDGENPDAS